MPRRKPKEKKEVEELHTGDLLLPEDFDPGAPPVDDSLLKVDTGDLVLPEDFDPDAPPVPGGGDLKQELFADLPPSGTSALIPLEVEPGRRGGGRVFRSGSTKEARAAEAAQAELEATRADQIRAAIKAADARAEARDLFTGPDTAARRARAEAIADEARAELDAATAKADAAFARASGVRSAAEGPPPPVERRARPRPASVPLPPTNDEFQPETDKGLPRFRPPEDPGLTNSEVAALDEVAREIEEERRPAEPKKETARARQPRPGADAEPQPVQPAPAGPFAKSRSRRVEQLPTELPAEQRADQVERAAQRFQAELEQRKAKTPVPPPVMEQPPEVVGPITRLLPVEDETATREITLVIVAGPDRGQHKLAKSETVIGRGSACDVRLGHSSISRQHASILRRGARTLVKDLGSQNGTAVNDRRLAGDQEVEVYSGDSVLVGQVACRLEGPGLLARPAGFAVPSHTSMSPAPMAAWIKAAIVGAAVAAVTAVALVAIFASGRGPASLPGTAPAPLAVPGGPPVVPAPAAAGPGKAATPAEAPPSAVAAVPAPAPAPAPAAAKVASAVPAKAPPEAAPEEEQEEEPAPRRSSSRSSRRGSSRHDRTASSASSSRSSRGSADDAFEEPAARSGNLPRRGAEDDRDVARDALTLFKAGDLDGSIETAGNKAPQLADELRGFKKAFADGNGSLGFQDAAGAISGYTKAFRIHTQLTGGRGRFASELKEKLAKLHFVAGHRALSDGDTATAKRELQETLKYDPEHGAARRDLDSLDGGGGGSAPKKKKSSRSAADDAWESSE